LWFVEGANIPQIMATITSFDETRHADLWSGVGLACAYAGGVELHDVEALRASARHYLPHVAQGAAFAANARQRAGNSSAHTNLASSILCGMSAEAATVVTDDCLSDLRGGDTVPAYEVWRRRVQERIESVSGIATQRQSTEGATP